MFRLGDLGKLRACLSTSRCSCSRIGLRTSSASVAGTTGKNDAITRAISRKGRAIEFTTFLQDGMAGLDAYMRQKIEVYARMLESV